MTVVHMADFRRPLQILPDAPIKAGDSVYIYETGKEAAVISIAGSGNPVVWQGTLQVVLSPHQYRRIRA